MHLENAQWIGGVLAALLIGISKTGMPGTAFIAVAIMAALFGGRTSVGMVVPMLIVGDIFAVLWFRRHSQWDKIWKLVPWMAGGMAAGAVALWAFGEIDSSKDVMAMAIGILVLVMLGQYLLRNSISEHLSLTSPLGTAATGITAGFATVVANSAMLNIYFTAHKMTKEELIGTQSWFFMALNVSKIPLFTVLTLINPAKPMLSAHSLRFDLTVLPAIIVGVFVGRWVLARFSQRRFDVVLLTLAAIGAVRLIVG